MSCRVISSSIRTTFQPSRRIRRQSSSSSAAMIVGIVTRRPGGRPRRASWRRRRMPWPRRSGCPIRGRPGGCRPSSRATAPAAGRRRPPTSGRSSRSWRAFVEPALGHLAIAVDELDEPDLGIDLAKSLEALVAGPCRGERSRRGPAPRPPRPGSGPVRRCRRSSPSRRRRWSVRTDQGVEAATKPLAFVAADRDDTDFTHQNCMPGWCWGGRRDRFKAKITRR